MLEIRELANSCRGKKLAVLACGPSLSEIEDLAELLVVPGVDTLAINTPDPRCWPTDYWMLLDRPQWELHQQLICEYAGRQAGVIFCGVQGRLEGIPLLSLSEQVREHTCRLPLIGHTIGFRQRPPFNMGRSSTFVAVQLAQYLGYDSTWIFGMDMASVAGREHHWDDTPISASSPAPDTPPVFAPPRDTGPVFDRWAADAKCWHDAVKHFQVRPNIVVCSIYNQQDFTGHLRVIDQLRAVQEIRLTK